jgi:hypothetical protein
MRAHWVWVVIALAACSRRGSCGHIPDPGEADPACMDWAIHYCNRLAFCAPVSVQIGYGDVGRCIERTKPVCSAALRARNTGASSTSVAACAQAYDSASCDDVVVAKPPEACNVSGSLAPGSACGDDSQCAGPSGYCRIAADRNCGICAKRGPVGAACDSARDCQYGLVCFFTCMAPVALGAPCDGMTRQCPETLVCFNYKCSSRGERGDSCDPRADSCDGDHSLYCQPQEKVCVPYAIVEIGAPCGTGTICKSGSCLSATCIANAADGASCDGRAGLACEAPARCVEGRCQGPDPSACR